MRRIMLLLTVTVVMVMVASAMTAEAEEKQEAGGIDIADCVPSGGMIGIDPNTGEIACVPREPTGPGEEPPEPPQPGPDPIVTINTPAEGQRFNLGQAVIADFSCQPGEPRIGLRSCSAFNDFVFRANTVDIPTAIVSLDTSTVGIHIFRVVTEDTGGRFAERTHRYEVIDPRCPPDDGVKAKGGGELPRTGGGTPLVAAGAAAAGVLILGAATMLVGRRISRR